MLQTYNKNKKNNILISISIILVVLTSLRIPGIPFGIGEFLLSISLLLKFSKKPIKDEINLISFKIIKNYWILIFISLLFGMLVNLATPDKSISFTTLAAYIFCFVVSICITCYCSYDDILDIVKYMVQIGTIFFFLLFLYSIFVEKTIFGIELYYASEKRFSGGAKNPNQLALFLFAIPFISFKFLLQYINKHQLKYCINWLAILVLSIFLGFQTGSDAIIGAWTIGIIFLLYRVSLIKIKRIIPRIFVFVFVFTIFAIVANFNITNIFINWFYDLDAGGSRQQLWIEGLNVSKESLFIGYGPGSFCGNTASEAHNTIIDFFTQGGIIALIGIISLFYKIYKNIRFDIVLSSAMVTLIMYSMGHFVGRQPIFYLYIIFFIFMGQHNVYKNNSFV